MNKDIYRNIAAVTAIFIISLSVMLITNYFQVRGVTPLQTEVVETLKPMIAAAYAAIHLFIYWVLVTFTNSTVPFWDSLTTSLSIVGMWMLSRKYLEQWFVWFVVNLVTVGLYFYKEIPLTALLYTIYLTMSLAGYFRWRRMMRRQMRG